MDVREKLVELLDDMQRSGTGYFGSAIENKKIVGISILNESIKAQEECRKRVFVWKQP